MAEHKNEMQCPIAKKCGGCQMQNLSYTDQLKWKQSQVNKLLGSFCKPKRIIGMKDPYHYRNKMQRAFGVTRGGKPVSGIWQSTDRRIAVCDDCLLEDPIAGKVAEAVRKLLPAFKLSCFDPKSGKGFLRHILVRKGFQTGEVLVVLVGASPVFPQKASFGKALKKACPEITTLLFSVNDKEKNLLLGEKMETIFGEGYIEDRLCGLTFLISPRSFYQVNPVQTEVLYKKALELAALTGKETVLDAYCGVGTIGLAAAGKAAWVVGVELNRDAIKDAGKNAKKNGIENVTFVCADAEEYLREAANQDAKVDVAFLDPPRAGSSKGFLQALIKITPKKIVYVSCNPVTQARDLRILTKAGYKVGEMQPVDMFPFTHHVENIAVLTK